MKQKKSVVLLAILLFSLTLSASISDSEISTYEGEELKWEDGAYGHFVMFKSNIEIDSETSQEKCVDEKTGTTFTLDSTHIPSDALIERAFLVWTGAVPIENFNDVTDNEVAIKFGSTDGQITLDEIITASKAYKTTESTDFEFEAIRDEETLHSFFTYRVDITNLFKDIQEQGRYLGVEHDGYSLYGDYNVSGLACASDKSYADTLEMLSGWSVILIYVSQEITTRNIYFYNEFDLRSYNMTNMNVKGFEFPKDPKIKITMSTHLGDPDLFEMEHPEGVMAPPEIIQVQGDYVGYIWLTNECNPQIINPLGYIETFNSISSVFGWHDMEPTCISTEPSIDVDTFVLDSSKDDKVNSHFSKGGERIGFQIGANKDRYITNYMIVETDTKAPIFDIPGRAELVACTPANKDGKWCENGEHTFAIRIQNWGDDMTPPVTVKASIPEGMEYIPGTTEYSTDFYSSQGEMIGTDWKRVPDLENLEFPLEEGFQVADTIPFCGWEDDYLSCSGLIMVRFRAKVKDDITKQDVIEASASINTIGFPDYKTNLGIPLKLRLEQTDCDILGENIDLSKCGGTNYPDICTSDADCGEFECCYIEDGASSGTCVDLPCGPPPNYDDDNYSEDSDNIPDDDLISEKTDDRDLIIVEPDGCGCSII